MLRRPLKQETPWYRKGQDLLNERKRPSELRAAVGFFNRPGNRGLQTLRDQIQGSLLAGATSSVVYILPQTDRIRVSVSPDEDGSATVETTVSTYDDIVAGDAIWVAWSAGDVSEATDEVIETPITALRVVSNEGPVQYAIKGR